MIEFFNNCWAWCVENRDSILLFFTSGQFVALVAMIVNTVKTIKSVKNNTSSTSTLNESIKQNSCLVPATEQIENNTKQLISSLTDVKSYIEGFKSKIDETLSLQTDKINAIIEVQSIVYSTIKDEKVRNTVNNLLVNAKYSETATRAELQKQVEELQATVAAQVEQLNATVATTVDKVKSVVSTEPTDSDGEFIRG